MENDIRDAALRLCAAATNPDMSNADVRIGAWIIGAAHRTGGFPLPLTKTQIRSGFNADGVQVAGTGSRPETIDGALENLQNLGLLTITDAPAGVVTRSKLFTMKG